ncbi:hypothetical protein [Brevibacterium marinum]|nr:hypothetical protein [Brevibacterium marinum]
MKDRRQRALRGSLAASFATFVALTSHVIGGGSLPTMMGLIVPLVLSTLVCVLLAGRQLSLWRLSASVGGSQALFHLLFMVFTPKASAAAPAAVFERHALRHTGHHESMGPMGSMGGTESAMHAHTSTPMIVAHMVAAVITIAMIYFSESLPSRLWEFGRLIIRALMPVHLGLHTVPEGPRSMVAVTQAIPRSLGVLRSPVLKRGPPRAAF